jgi:serine/threonine protein kinase/tetratricopeptide (TPR) repeat protein
VVAGGLCPACLLQQVAHETDTGADGFSDRPWTPPAPGDLAASFPHFEIIELIGRGGMGAVYKARQKSLSRFVALKILNPQRAARGSFAARFSREAQALAELNHPNIVTVHDFGRAGEFYFLLMEYLDGVNLRQAMKAGRFTPEQALAIVPSICDALQFAHDHGIVHRDIKPENLLLDRTGRVKIADFGIARLVGAGQESGSDAAAAANELWGLTQESVLGTPQYMAPEQSQRPAQVDHRADIYSLGVVLYELLTGELPTGQFVPPSRTLRIDVRLDAIVLRALEQTPERRYQTIGELRGDVQTVIDETVSAKPPGDGDELASPPIHESPCFVITPEELATFEGQFWLYSYRGRVRLDDRQLAFVRAGMTMTIPLAAIRDLSLGHYPWPLSGLDFISVTYEAGGLTAKLFFTPYRRWFQFRRAFKQCMADWLSSLHDAVVAATGRAPASTPTDQLGTPGTSVWTLISMIAPLAVAAVAFSIAFEPNVSERLWLFLTVVIMSVVAGALVLRHVSKSGWGRKLLPLTLIGPPLLLGGVMLVVLLRLQRGMTVPFVDPVEVRPALPIKKAKPRGLHPRVDRRRVTDEKADALEAAVKQKPDDVESRVKLLEHYFARPGPDMRKARHAHIFWLIENQPRNPVLGTPHGGMHESQDGDAYHQAKALWYKQVEANPRDPVVLGNAAAFLLLDREDEAEALLERCRRLEPQSADWPEKLAHLNHLKMIGADSDADRKRFALEEVRLLEQALALNHDDVEIASLLPDLARACFEAGEYAKARDHATRLLARVKPDQTGSDAGNAIYYGNFVLGRLALRAGDLEGAKRHLLQAGKTPGSPVLNSFGPDMTLAKELLERGQAETVLQYFDLCKRFWKHNPDKLKEWSRLVKAGIVPDFGGNLSY